MVFRSARPHPNEQARHPARPGIPWRTLENFRADVDASFFPLDVTPREAASFRGRLRNSSAEGVSFTSVRAEPHTIERTPALIARHPEPYLKLSLHLEGRAHLVQNGTELVAGPGELLIYNTNRPYRVEFLDPFLTTVVQLPTSMLGDLAPRAEHINPLLVPGDDGMARMVTPFLATLGEHIEAVEVGAGAKVVASATKFLTALIEHDCDLASLRASSHNQLMIRIRDDIDSRLGDPDLTPASIAANAGVSVRQLHSLFAPTGTTVGNYVRSRRLECCFLDLANPQDDAHTIAEVGRRWGFHDAAHFSRSFRAAFDETPTALRERVAGVLT